MTVLFVCTGNTCRSPMAEAIARHRLASRAGGGRIEVASAGLSASGGEARSPETDAALAALGVPAIGGAARPVTRQMLTTSDVIYTMTASHARALAAIDPTCADRVYVLDPDGSDVPDPIGGPPAVYAETARALDAMIARRLEELDQA